MQVIVSESAGFCYGVSRALHAVLETAKSSGKAICTLGPLIHNPQVIRKLEENSVKSVGSLDEVPPDSIVVMPSHGVSKSVVEQAQTSGMEIVDVTCPFVSKVHTLAESLVEEGYQVLILGDRGHTEVRGILSRAGDDAIAVSGSGELVGVRLKNRVGILAQTTQTIDQFQSLVKEVAGMAHEIRAYNTICNATMDRQKAAVTVSEGVDTMVVVGGRNSANTRRLAEICAETGVNTYHIEVAGEIQEAWFAGKKTVGVTAGASTPDWIISEVVERIENIA